MPPLVNGFADTLMFGSVNRKYTTFIRNFNILPRKPGEIYRLLKKQRRRKMQTSVIPSR